MNKVIVKKSSRRGANFVEYMVLVGVIALAGIAIFQAFSGKVKTAAEQQGQKVESLGGGGGGH
jgi:Flp pilus assembly pilin Flp